MRPVTRSLVEHLATNIGGTTYYPGLRGNAYRTPLYLVSIGIRNAGKAYQSKKCNNATMSRAFLLAKKYWNFLVFDYRLGFADTEWTSSMQAGIDVFWAELPPRLRLTGHCRTLLGEHFSAP